MRDPINEIAALTQSLASVTKLAYIVMLEENSMKKISGEGLLRKKSGHGVKVSVMTIEDLMKNVSLKEIQRCAKKGLLGGMNAQGDMQFRADMAQKIRGVSGGNQVFITDDKTVINAQVQDISHDLYTELKNALELLMEASAGAQVKESTEKDTKATPHAAPHTKAQFSNKEAPKVTAPSFAQKSKANDNYLKQQASQQYHKEEHRRFETAMKKIEEAKKKDRERLKEAVKKEDANKETRIADTKKIEGDM